MSSPASIKTLKFIRTQIFEFGHHFSESCLFGHSPKKTVKYQFLKHEKNQ